MAYYELQFPHDVRVPKGKNRQAFAALVEWIRESEQILRERNADHSMPTGDLCTANDRIIGTPPGFDCEFELLQWPFALSLGREPGSLSYRFIPPEEEEALRADSLRRTFSRKCPKLYDCKKEGARTVLILESGDAGCSHFKFRGDLLPSVLSGCPNVPDEIFLVETSIDHFWRVQLLKRDGKHWPDTGMPELGGFYYDPDQSDIPEYLESFPRQMRDALQLDRMQTPFLRGWAPATFDKDELDDLNEP